MAGLFDMLDQIVADGLKVDVKTFIDTIDLFNDEDMEAIMFPFLNDNSSEEERNKARELFNTKLNTI